MPSARKFSAYALVLLMALEGLRLVPYKDEAGVWTDGYGNTSQVVPGKPITQAKAKADLERHVDVFTDGVLACVNDPLTQNQLDAYVLLAYNIGKGLFCSSSVVKDHNAGRYAKACDDILKFNKLRQRGVLRYSQGLANRRAKERDLCLMP